MMGLWLAGTTTRFNFSLVLCKPLPLAGHSQEGVPLAFRPYSEEKIETVVASLWMP